jgi:hypothetical protein
MKKGLIVPKAGEACAFARGQKRKPVMTAQRYIRRHFPVLAIRSAAHSQIMPE